MHQDKLKIGGVYKTSWSDSPYRVIGLDDIEIFYDRLWPHNNSWTFSGHFKRKCYFYRTSAALFLQQSQFIEDMPLTEEEQLSFRPDLPIRLVRTKELSWNNFSEQGFREFRLEITKYKDKSFLDQKLPTGSIVLIPYGNNGGKKRGTIVVADNQEYFDVIELIWKAKMLQEAVNNKTSNGIGLYRIGFEKRLPSYYIGEYFERAGLMKE